MHPTRIASVFLLVLGLGCTGVPNGWRFDASTQDAIFEQLNLRFPPKFEDLVRDDLHTFDRRGENVSVGYTSRTRRLVLTLYVYPRTYGGQPDPLKHFKGYAALLLEDHPNATVEQSAGGAIAFGHGRADGFIVFFHYPSDGGDETGSIFILVPYEQSFIKLRVSFSYDGSQEAVQPIRNITDRFLRSLDLPKPRMAG